MRYVWSLGIYQGQSPLTLSPAAYVSNPVLTYRSVTDVPAAFVADPFMVKADDAWYMFFEVFNRASGRGEIALASSSNTRDWHYKQIVLKERYHLSYPYVFDWQGEYYMLPETLQPQSIQLYKALAFPTEWIVVETLISGEFADPSIFRFDDRWWLFACSTPARHDTLRLYFAEELSGPWIEHPRSPIIKDNNRLARPAGRVLVFDNKVIRYAQDCYPRYGSQVRAFEISVLTTSEYHETECAESPIFKATGSGWNEIGMHHVDPHLMSDGSWIACVDGLRPGIRSNSDAGIEPGQIYTAKHHAQ